MVNGTINSRSPDLKKRKKTNIYAQLVLAKCRPMTMMRPLSGKYSRRARMRA